MRVGTLCVLLHIVASRLAWRWHLAHILLILRLDRFRKWLLVRLVLRARWRVRRNKTILRLVRSCHYHQAGCPGTAATRSHTARNALQTILQLKFGLVNEQVMRRRDCAVKCRISRMLRCIAARVVTCTCRRVAGDTKFNLVSPEGWKLREHRRHGGQHPACYTGYDTVTHHQLVVLLYACMQDCCLASRLMHARGFRARNDGSQGRVGAAHAQCTGR